MGEPVVYAPAIITEALNRARAEEFVLEWITRSNIQRQQRIPVWDEVLDNYYVIPAAMRGGIQHTGTLGTQWMIPPTTPRRSILKDPESHQIVESLLAKIIALQMGGPDYVAAIPIGREDVDGASTVSALIEMALAYRGSFRSVFEANKSGLIFGNSYLQVGWELEFDRVLRRLPFKNAAGQVATFFAHAKTRVKDNIWIRPIDIYDIFRDPSVARFEDSNGVVIRGRVTAQLARDMAREGPNGEPPAWDPDEVEEAIGYGTTSREYESKYGDVQRRYEMAAAPDDYGTMTCFDFWGSVPWKPDDGTEHWLDAVRRRRITILNGRCVQDSAHPLLYGRNPVVEFVPNPVDGRPWGMTPLEVNRFLQDHTDTMLMLLQDASIEAVKGGLLISDSWLDPEAVERRRVGQNFKVTDTEGVKPLPLMTNGFFQAAAQRSSNKTDMRQAGGAPDPLQGISLQGRQSATAASAIIQGAVGRADLMAKVLEETALPELGRLIHDRYRQFIPDDGMLMKVVGKKQPFVIDFWDIDADYDIRFVGSQKYIGKMQKENQLSRAIQVLQQNPYVASKVNWVELLSLYLEEGLQRRDFEKFFLSEDDAIAQLHMMGALNGQGQGAGSPPNLAPGPGGNASMAELGGTSVA